jgi:hypothetical protein
MERRNELLAAWCGPLFVLFFGVGWLVAGLVPPPAATDGPARIADFYRFMLASYGSACCSP